MPRPARNAGPRPHRPGPPRLARSVPGLKAWKNLGLQPRDERGRLLLPDDERLGDSWEAAAAELPIVIHFERLIDALEAVVASHPSTVFIGAHVGCFAEDVAWVTRMLATYPNLHVDIAARIAELGRQPRAAARLFSEHPDRVLFGIDLFPPDPADYRIHFRFLETDDECFD